MMRIDRRIGPADITSDQPQSKAGQNSHRCNGGTYHQRDAGTEDRARVDITSESVRAKREFSARRPQTSGGQHGDGIAGNQWRENGRENDCGQKCHADAERRVAADKDAEPARRVRWRRLRGGCIGQ